MCSDHPLWTPNRAGLVGVIAIIASFVANAEAPQVTTEVKAKAKPAYRGSALSYGHQATATSFSRSAEPYYNPTWSHSLGLAPEWHFTDQLFTRAHLTLSQELTASDSTTRRNEVELSDLTLDLGVSGLTVPVAKIKIAGDFRVAFPTSRASRFATRLLAIGPALNLSRTFELRSGLTLAYAGRYSYRFHRFTTPQFDGIPNESCNRLDRECQVLGFGGRRNAHSEVTHGPTISFAPHERVSIAATFLLTHQFLYRLPAAEVSVETVDVGRRDYTSFDVSVAWQVFKPAGLTLGSSTFSPQLDPSGKRYFPLFNRNTTLYLDASFDLEAAVSGLLGEST